MQLKLLHHHLILNREKNVVKMHHENGGLESFIRGNALQCKQID